MTLRNPAVPNCRDDHRRKMLADTEATFCTLTVGEYSELRTQSDGQYEVLLALRKRNGRSVIVSEMPKGTGFQLYLALRLAGYHQYSASGTTLRFVADGIMETFHNTRLPLRWGSCERFRCKDKHCILGITNTLSSWRRHQLRKNIKKDHNVYLFKQSKTGAISTMKRERFLLEKYIQTLVDAKLIQG